MNLVLNKDPHTAQLEALIAEFKVNFKAIVRLAVEDEVKIILRCDDEVQRILDQSIGTHEHEIYMRLLKEGAGHDSKWVTEAVEDIVTSHVEKNLDWGSVEISFK